MKEETTISECFPSLVSVLGGVWSWLENISETLWSGLGWPHAVLIMFFIVICSFKAELKSVIPRIKKVGADGFEVDSIPPTQSVEAPREPQKSPPIADFPSASQVVADFLDREMEGIAETERAEYLRRDSIGWRVVCYFENTYSQIFGGQIQLLKLLNERGDTGLSMEDVSREWDGYKERFKPNLDGWALEPFLGFLSARHLVNNDGVKLTITPIGREFIVWMAKFGRSEQRMW
ncbi:hypothetical protein [Pseudomonas putida]|uniref:hypothetical protein n=1 Tax=Pseudomonas putida TaxID=303 RepID=UPI0012603BCD|nr:hypothetical protein [Pseudomonas putida]